MKRRAASAFPLAIVLAVALVWRLAFLLSIRDSPLAYLHEWAQSDMATFYAQAGRIADGDWLARAPVYPYHSWMQAVPKEEWASWHSPAMFYQPPLYSYALAGLMAVKLDAPSAARWGQLLLGVAACGLMFAMTARLLGRGAGLAAGLIQGVYGPLLMSESQLLRDGPIVFWLLLILWLAVDTLALERRRAVSTADWRWRVWLLGLLLGVQAMLHEAAMFLWLSIALVGVWVSLRERGRYPARHWLALLAIGGLLGYGPMLARNIALHAPAGPSYFGSAQAFAIANNVNSADPLKINFPSTPLPFVQLMRRAQGSPLVLAAETLREYGSGWPLFFKHWIMRLAALGIGQEAIENLSYNYFKRRVPILSMALDFRFLLPLTLTGGAMLGLRRWRGRLRGGLGLLLLQGVLTMGLVSLVYPFGRYRLMFLPLMLPLAGYAVTGFVVALRGHRWPRVGRCCGLIIFFALAQFGLSHAAPFNGLGLLRQADFILSSRFLAKHGNFPGAIAELEEARSLFPEDQIVQSELALNRGMALQAAGDYDQAAEQYRQSLALNPKGSVAKLGLATSLEHRPLGKTTPEP